MEIKLDSASIKSLHRKYAASDKAFDIVFVHCEIVSKIAEQVVENNNLDVDRDLIISGAFLHDLGAYKFVDSDGNFNEIEYIKHGVEGYRLLKNEKLPEEVCRIAERHTGVGISKEEILKRQLPLEPKDYFAESLEEEVVMYADKFHSKPGRFNSFETYKKYVSKYGEANAIKFQKFADRFGIPDLGPISKEYGHDII